MRRALPVLLLALAVVAAGRAQQRPVPPRDPGAPPGTAAAGSASISGIVVVAGTGQPARRARVNISSPEVQGSRSATTGDDGRFAFSALPAGRYTLRVSKPGYVSVSYGQTRPGPGRPGTPIQLAADQKFEAQIQLPRGGVITGTILDEQGEAIPGTPVRVLRFTMQNGVRTLQQAGGGATDDRGIYRVYGLQPGEYVVLATPRNSGRGGIGVGSARAEIVGRLADRVAAGAAAAVEAQQSLEAALADQIEADDTGAGYAPVYYPGTTIASSAAAVSVGAGEERSGIDFHLQLVPIARVEGIVVNGTEHPLQASGAQVMLVPVGQGLNAPGVGTHSTRAASDGRFSIDGVGPGHYVLLARGVAAPRGAGARAVNPEGPGGARGQAGAAGRGRGLISRMRGPDATRLWATLDVAVDGRNVSNLVLTLQAGLTVSGRVAFEGTAQPPADLTRLRMTLVPADASAMPRELMMPAQGRVDADGRFTFASVVPGLYRLTAGGVGAQWVPASAIIGGQDALDFPVEIKPGGNASGAIVTFTDRRTELSGTLTDSRGQPAPDYTLIIYPEDPTFWSPQSRRIRSTRPATDGRFAVNDLPPGAYRICPVIDPEPGAWFDPAFLQQLDSAALRVTLAEGEKKVQDIRLSVQ